MSLPGFPSVNHLMASFAFVTPFILWQGERGGGGLTYVSTWLCPCHFTGLTQGEEGGGVF